MLRNLDTAFGMLHSCKKEIEYTEKGVMDEKSLMAIYNSAQDIMMTSEWIKMETLDEINQYIKETV